MVIVRLIGGLGNQLFQYAFGRYVAILNDTVLKLDISGFEEYKLHAYSLGHFNITEEFATKEEVEGVKARARKRGAIKRLLFGKGEGVTSIHCAEKPFGFKDEYLEVRGDEIYLEGSWQSERFFHGVGDTIRGELTVKSAPRGKDYEVGELIKSTCGVNLHIRRADYATNEKTKSFHGLCGLDYYKEAVERIRGVEESPHLFIFSDDHEWVRDNLKVDGPVTFVAHNDAGTNYEDLRLMSLCKHHIIANSTFSWWGAWLGGDKDKVVIAPSRWFQTGDLDSSHVVPGRWIRI